MKKKIPIVYDDEEFSAHVHINCYGMVKVYVFKFNPAARFFHYSYIGDTWFWVDDFQSIAEGVQRAVKTCWDADLKTKENQKKIEDFKNNY